MKYVAYSFLALLSLSGCKTIENFDNVHVVPEAKVIQTNLSMSVEFDFASSVIEEDQIKAIENFIIRHDVREQDELIIRINSQGGAVFDARAKKVSAYLKHLGLAPSYQVNREGDNLDEVDIQLNRYQVSVPDCPNWRSNPTSNFNNQPHSNFGCAQAQNLALMIGDPRDLLRAQELSAPDGYVLSNAVRTYQVPRGGWAQGSSETTTTSTESQ